MIEVFVPSANFPGVAPVDCPTQLEQNQAFVIWNSGNNTDVDDDAATNCIDINGQTATITKTGVPTSAYPGQVIDYTIEIENHSSSAILAVDVVDILGPELNFLGQTGGTCPTSVFSVVGSGGGTTTVTWNDFTLAAGPGFTCTILYQAEIEPTFAGPYEACNPTNATTSNFVVLRDQTNTTIDDDDECIVVTAPPTGDVSIVKSGSTSWIIGSQLTYTLALTSTYPIPVPIEVTDVLPSPFTFDSNVVGTNDCGLGTPQTAGANPQTLTWPDPSGPNAGATIPTGTCNIRFTVDLAVTPGITEYCNAATVGHGFITTTQNTSNDYCVYTVDIEKDANPMSVQQGVITPVTYTLTISKPANSPAGGFMVDDMLPNIMHGTNVPLVNTGLSTCAFGTPPGTVPFYNGLLLSGHHQYVWAIQMPTVGAASCDIVFVVDTVASAPMHNCPDKPYINVANVYEPYGFVIWPPVQGTNFGNPLDTDEKCVIVTDPPVDPIIKKSAVNPPGNMVGSGGIITYVIEISNPANGQPGPFVLTDQLPPNFTYQVGTESSVPAHCTPNAADPVVTNPPGGDLLTWNTVNVPPGTSCEITYEVQAPTVTTDIICTENPGPFGTNSDSTNKATLSWINGGGTPTFDVAACIAAGFDPSDCNNVTNHSSDYNSCIAAGGGAICAFWCDNPANPNGCAGTTGMVMDTECVDVKAPQNPTVTKKVDPDTINNGDQITYYIIIENPSNPIALEYDIDDTLPAGFSYNSLVSVTPGTCAINGTPLPSLGDTGLIEFHDVFVAAGTTCELAYSVDVNLIGFPEGDILCDDPLVTNHVVVTPDGGGDDFESEACVNVKVGTFKIIKSGPIGPVQQPSEQQYTITIINDADSAVDTFDIVDQLPLPSDFEFIAVVTTSPGCSTVPTEVYNPTLQTVTWTGVVVEPGDTCSITYKVIVDPTGTSEHPNCPDPAVTNKATVTANQLTPPKVLEDDHCVPVLSEPTLDKTIDGTNTPAAVYPGDVITYTITISNTNSVPVTIDSVTDTVGTDLTLTNPQTPTGSCGFANAPTSNNGTTITWNAAGTYTIAPGTCTLIYTATVDANASPAADPCSVSRLTNDAVMTYGTPAQTSEDEVCQPVIGEPTLDKTIDGSNTPDAVYPGDVITYTITISNTNSVPVTIDSVTDTVGTDLTLTNPQTPTGSCGFAGSPTSNTGTTITWNAAGT